MKAVVIGNRRKVFYLTTTHLSGSLCIMNDQTLTPTQRRLLDSIRGHLDRGEPSPTYRELCAEFGWTSTGTVRDHLHALARKGFIRLSGRNSHRRLCLNEELSDVKRVPIVGRIVAGRPITGYENIEGELPVPGQWAGRSTCFAVRVAGDSMQDAGILEGDHVVVRQQANANDGDIVVATLEGETTLKRLRKRGNRAMLVADNPRYYPIEVKTESAVVQGVVLGLLRSYRNQGNPFQDSERINGVKRRQHVNRT